MTETPDDDRASRKPARRSRRRRRFTIVLGAIAGLVLLVSLATSLSPWPISLLIRAQFTQGGLANQEEMNRHQPDAEIIETRDVAYSTADERPADTTMDVFTPASADGAPLPTILWIHGGAWISGSKEDVDPYLRVLAAEGYTTIGVYYTLGPEGTYPTAVTQLNESLRYVQDHAAELGVDENQIFLAGDSAGAQLASQLAALTTNTEYARLLGIEPALTPDQLAGTILHCGVYDLRALSDLDGALARAFQVTMWAYSGSRYWALGSTGSTMSTINWVTEDFPPTFVSGGNGDPLTWSQGIPLSQTLDRLGVDVTTLFWPRTHAPSLPHEYQFQLDGADAQQALADTLDFLDAHTTP